MPITIEKEWAAVDGDEIVMKSDSKDNLLAELRQQDLDVDDYEIVAIPKSHSSMFV